MNRTVQLNFWSILLSMGLNIIGGENSEPILVKMAEE